MQGMDHSPFIDYYELMQIGPGAGADAIHRVYRVLAAKYQPDNAETGDMERFLQLNQGYKILSDPQSRSAYDVARQAARNEPISIFSMREFAKGISGEQNRRMGILCLLYHQRRINPDDAGLSILELENMMSFPREHLMFTLWYLREKDYVRSDSQSDFCVTSNGVDFVEQHLPKNEILHKLLMAAEAGAVHGTVPPSRARENGQSEADRPAADSMQQATE
jgi:hypothetical protein